MWNDFQGPRVKPVQERWPEVWVDPAAPTRDRQKSPGAFVGAGLPSRQWPTRVFQSELGLQWAWRVQGTEWARGREASRKGLGAAGRDASLAVAGRPSQGPVRIGARDCEVTGAQGREPGVRGPVPVWPPAQEGRAAFLLLSEPRLPPLEPDISKDLTLPPVPTLGSFGYRCRIGKGGEVGRCL